MNAQSSETPASPNSSPPARPFRMVVLTCVVGLIVATLGLYRDSEVFEFAGLSIIATGLGVGAWMKRGAQ